MGPIKSLWAMVQGDPVFMRRVNGWLAIFWILMIPISLLMGWLDSVVYVSALLPLGLGLRPLVGMAGRARRGRATRGRQAPGQGRLGCRGGRGTAGADKRRARASHRDQTGWDFDRILSPTARTFPEELASIPLSCRPLSKGAPSRPRLQRPTSRNQWGFRVVAWARSLLPWGQRGRPAAQDVVEVSLIRGGNELRGEGRHFDVRVLAMPGEPVKGLGGADIEIAHDHTLGLFDEAAGRVCVRQGGRSGLAALDGHCPRQVDGQAMDGRHLPGPVPVGLRDGQDAVFTALAIDDSVKVGALTAVASQV